MVNDTLIIEEVNQTIASTPAFNLLSHFAGILTAIGGVLFIYLLFNIFNYFQNKKKVEELERMNIQLSQIRRMLSRMQK